MILQIVSLIALIYWLYLYKTREVIYDADDGPYLIRYFLWKPKKGDKYYLHHIMRSDHDRSEHCHPFNFTSLILWGGYYEIADSNQSELRKSVPGFRCTILKPEWEVYGKDEAIRWFSPFSILHRRAEWRHRLLLKGGQTAWTFVKRSPKIRDWGFYPEGKFCHNTKYNIKTGLCDD